MPTPPENEPVVLIIGTLDREGILSSLKTAGRRYVVKRIDSSPDNWQTICARFAEEQVDCALLKLTGTTYGYLSSTQYAAVRDALLGHVGGTRHAIFVHESLFTGTNPGEATTDGLEDDGHGSFFNQPSDEVRLQVNALLANRGLEVIPYTNNAELTVMASTFIADAGLMFRLYVPVGRIWAAEIDRLLTLFRDYLSNVGHQDVVLNQQRAKHGVVYEFFSPQELKRPNGTGERPLAKQFGEFSQLLDLCLTDVAEAERVLARHSIEPTRIASILTRYMKEARRLQVDLRQEREQKVLSIRHRLESELVDEFSAGVTGEVIASLVEGAVPAISGLGSALTGLPQNLQISAGNGGNITVNLRPQMIQAVNAVVAEEVGGDINLSSEDQQILELIQTHAPEQIVELGTAVREVADPSLPKPARIFSGQRLKAFLAKLAGKIPDVAAGLLQEYLKRKIGL